jgi:hypothetical protein
MSRTGPPAAQASTSEADSVARASGGGQPRTVRAALGKAAPSLVVNAVLPYLAFQYLSGHGVDDVSALTISAVFPLVGIVWGVVRTRHADVIALVSLAFIIIGVVTSVVSGNPRFILIRESFVTGLFGAACLVSLVMPRPLLFYFGRHFGGGGDPRTAQVFDTLWQKAEFRTMIRRMTLVWGLGLLLEAVLRVVLSYTLPIGTFLLLSRPLFLAMTFGLIAWTVSYGRRSMRQQAVLDRAPAAD